MPDTPPPPTPKARDPWLARLYDDINVFVDDEGKLQNVIKAPEAPVRNAPPTVTLGEAARIRAELKQEQNANDKSKEQTGEKAAEKQGGKTEDQTGNVPGGGSAAPPKEDKLPAPPPIRVAHRAQEAPLEDLINQAVRRSVKEVNEEARQAAAPKVEEPKADPNQSITDDLTDDRQDEIELLQFAEKQHPRKYAGVVQKALEGYKREDGYIRQKAEENPDHDFQRDPGMTAFENSHGLNRKQLREIRGEYQDERIQQGIKKTVEETIRPELARIEQQARAAQLRPEIDRSVSDFRGQVLNTMADTEDPDLKEALSKAKTKGWNDWAEVEAADKIASDYIQGYANQAVTMGREYAELFTGVKDVVAFDDRQPANSPQNQEAIRQQNLLRFIDRQEQALLREPVEVRRRNGLMFTTRDQYSKMTAADQAKHWLLGPNEVSSTLAQQARDEMERAYKSERERLEKAGYVKAVKAAAPKKEDPPKPPPAANSSPRASVSPSPGVGDNTQPDNTDRVISKKQFEDYTKEGDRRWV